MALRLIGIGRKAKFQLRWCRQVYVDWGDVESPAGACWECVFSEFITLRQILARSRTNVCFKRGRM